MNNSPFNDFLLNLAAGLTRTLLEAGARRLKQAALGTDEERALEQALQEGFAGLLAAVDAQLPAGDLREEQAALVHEIFRTFLRQDDVADKLLDLALAGTSPDLEVLAQAFDTLDFDRDTLPVDFKEALTAFHRALTAALVEEARQAGSPLFQQVILGRILEALAGALRDERSARPVWLWNRGWVGDEIKQEGTLDQHLYAALLRVAGFSG